MPTISTSTPTHRETLTIEAFRAVERPDVTGLYCAGQAESYRRHPGSAAALQPVHLAEAHIVLVRAGDGTPVGGMRAHPRRPDIPLPVERALAGVCPISQAIAAAPGPLIELCGTWVAPGHRGSELAAILTSAALAVARGLGARQIVGCAHQHVIALYRRFGAVVDPALGVHPYPDARYQTCVFWADPFACPEEQAVRACAELLRTGAPLALEPLPQAA